MGSDPSILFCRLHFIFWGPQPINLTDRDSIIAKMHSCQRSDHSAKHSRDLESLVIYLIWYCNLSHQQFSKITRLKQPKLYKTKSVIRCFITKRKQSFEQNKYETKWQIKMKWSWVRTVILMYNNNARDELSSETVMIMYIILDKCLSTI